jgi:hypothetical protein
MEVLLDCYQRGTHYPLCPVATLLWCKPWQSKRCTSIHFVQSRNCDNLLSSLFINYAATAVSPNSNHQVQRVPLFTVDRTAKPVSNAAQTLEDQQVEDPESQELFLQCLTPVWNRDIRVFARQLEEYSGYGARMGRSKTLKKLHF